MHLIKRTFFIGLVLFAAVGLAHARDLESFAGKQGMLKIAGGTAHIPVMKEVAKEIMTAYPDIRITIAGGGSGVGIKQVGEGLIDIGNAGRQATDKEISSYNLHPVKWAIDGVAIVVHPGNRVTSLTSGQLQEIFSGKTTNWKSLGGEDRSINLYTRDESSGTREVFWEKALNKDEISSKANTVVSNGAMKTAIAGDPASIGYVSVGHIDSTVAAVTLDGISPTKENVTSGAYKVARGLFSMTKGEPSGLAKSFLDFMLSPTGQKIAQEEGFIPVR
jgi:phosphate transport system substrate-binding protein